MSVGITYTKAQIDGTAGNLARDFENAIVPLERFAQWLQATPDATLISLGYVQAEVNTLKSAYVTDVLTLIAIYRGTSNLATARDFRTFLHQLWGAGI